MFNGDHHSDAEDKQVEQSDTTALSKLMASSQMMPFINADTSFTEINVFQEFNRVALRFPHLFFYWRITNISSHSGVHSYLSILPALSHFQWM